MDVLQQPTLVLNRQWQAIHITTVVRALIMLWNESARAIDPDEYVMYAWSDWMALEAPEDGPAIRTTRGRLRLPEVIGLAHYDRLGSSAVTFSRRNVARRDHYTCQYCGVQPGVGRITVDHVIPRSQGGATTWTNCVAACLECNGRKADRTPEQARMRLRHPPIRPEWRPHFAAIDRRPASWDRFLPVETALALA